MKLPVSIVSAFAALAILRADAASGGRSCVNVGPEWRTLWYEILVSKTTKGSEK